jgi:hypothetical protein
MTSMKMMRTCKTMRWRVMKEKKMKVWMQMKTLMHWNSNKDTTSRKTTTKTLMIKFKYVSCNLLISLDEQ